MGKEARVKGAGQHPVLRFSRSFAMANCCTFKIPPIADFVYRHTIGAAVIVDPFARDSNVGTITNDLNPNTKAQYHMQADEFLGMLVDQGTQADVFLCAPPYSPRQVKECYQGVGIKTTQQDTQSSFYIKIGHHVHQLIKPSGIILSFGWNSMGVGSAFDHVEVLLVSHGGAHNDTICVAQQAPTSLFDGYAQ